MKKNGMINRKWQYTDTERDPAMYGACYDCGLPYDQFPTELVIDHEVWELINPTHHKGAGLLCHSCMIERLRDIRYSKIIPVLHFHVRFDSE